MYLTHNSPGKNISSQLHNIEAHLYSQDISHAEKSGFLIYTLVVDRRGILTIDGDTDIHGLSRI